jgi:hypothetical protein
MRFFATWQPLAAALLLAGALVSGCSTMGDSGGIAANDQPGQLPPVTDSTVSSSALPPIGGADGSVEVATAAPYDTNPNGMPMPQSDAGGAGLVTGSTAGAPTTAPGAAAPAGPGGFVSLDDVGKVPSTPGRDLSGGLTVEKLLGGWTVTSGTSTCRLNLTYTSTVGNTRYRASAPGCVIPTLGAVSSWQLAGTQVQLFDSSNKMVGALLLSGNRFIGTLTGGQAITMAG